MSLIEVKNLIVDFDILDEEGNVESSKRVLNGIDFCVDEGEFICILGKNGSGKSTLAKTLNSLVAPSSGDVYVNGMNTKDESNTIKIRQIVGMAFQNPDNQIVASIVEEDVAFGMENLGLESSEMDKRIDEALDTLGILESRYSQTNKLSGGQKQKVSLAGILCMKSKILVLDEPTSMIDKNGRIDLLNKVYELNKKEGITVILISHYIEEITYADRVLVMNNGIIINDDTPKNIVLKDDILKEAGVELPYITRLSKKLKDSGKNLKGNEFTVSELCQFLK